MQLSSTDLFGNVPKNNYFEFYENNKPDYKKVVDCLEFKKQDVALATQCPTNSIRYDENMPKELKDRIEEWANLLQLVAQFFKDEHKTLLWFRMPNPLLGNISPKDMIRIGRYKKLLKFVQHALSQNE